MSRLESAFDAVDELWEAAVETVDETRQRLAVERHERDRQTLQRIRHKRRLQLQDQK